MTLESDLYNTFKKQQEGIVSWSDVEAAALAYARPIVAEECARIIEAHVLKVATAAIGRDAGASALRSNLEKLICETFSLLAADWT